MLGCSIFHQITGNHFSKFPDLKNFLGACSYTPLEDKGPLAPLLYQLRQVLAKGRHLLQILLKALMIAQTFLCFSFTAVIQLFVVGCKPVMVIIMVIAGSLEEQRTALYNDTFFCRM